MIKVPASLASMTERVSSRRDQLNRFGNADYLASSPVAKTDTGVF